jgi:hypothetical protein
LLKTQDPLVSVPEAGPTSFTSSQSSGVGLQPVGATDFGSQNPPGGVVNEVPTERWRYNEGSPQQPIDDLGFNPDINMSMGLDDTPFTWEMIGLGLEEPLPPRETIDELYVVGLIHSPDNTLTCKQTSNILRKNTSISADDTQVSVSRSNEPVSYWNFLEWIFLWFKKGLLPLSACLIWDPLDQVPHGVWNIALSLVFQFWKLPFLISYTYRLLGRQINVLQLPYDMLCGRSLLQCPRSTCISRTISISDHGSTWRPIT